MISFWISVVPPKHPYLVSRPSTGLSGPPHLLGAASHRVRKQTGHRQAACGEFGDRLRILDMLRQADRHSAQGGWSSAPPLSGQVLPALLWPGRVKPRVTGRATSRRLIPGALTTPSPMASEDSRARRAPHRKGQPMPTLLYLDGGCPIRSTRECAGSAAVTGRAARQGRRERRCR